LARSGKRGNAAKASNRTTSATGIAELVNEEGHNLNFAISADAVRDAIAKGSSEGYIYLALAIASLLAGLGFLLLIAKRQI
jgi:hypothetical protein